MGSLIRAHATSPIESRLVSKRANCEPATISHVSRRRGRGMEAELLAAEFKGRIGFMGGVDGNC